MPYENMHIHTCGCLDISTWEVPAIQYPSALQDYAEVHLELNESAHNQNRKLRRKNPP